MSDAPKPSRRSRSRSETKAAFSNLSEPQKLSPKEREAEAQRAEALRSSVANISAEKAAMSIASAGVAVQKALSAANEELVLRLSDLAAVRKNIELENAELARLNTAGIVLEHLDVLKAEHDEAKAALERQIQEARVRWADEEAEYKKAFALRKQADAEERARVDESNKYQTLMQRRAENDKFAEEIRVARLNEQTRSELIQKDWNRREEDLKLREKEFNDAKAAIQNHAAEIDKAVKSAVAIAESRLSREHAHAMSLISKDMETAKLLFENEKKSLTEALAQERSIVAALRADVMAANTKAAEIAQKALDASSGQTALAAVQKFASETGTNGSTRKS